MSSALFSWQEDFRRECGIRRGLILHGNTADLTSDPEVPGQWVALPAALTSLLRQRGYQHVVFWNRIMVSAVLMQEPGGSYKARLRRLVEVKTPPGGRRMTWEICRRPPLQRRCQAP